MLFKELLARADEETLRDIIGPAATSLLVRMDPELAKPSSLRRVVGQLYSPSTLMRDPSMRALLISTLPETVAQEFATRIIDNYANTQDPYSALISQKFRKGSKSEATLYALLGIDLESDSPDDQTPARRESRPTYALFPHQKRAVRSLERILETEDRRGVLHMPTGSGKTRTAMSYVADTLRKESRALVVWLAYSEELCEQAADEFENAWSKLGDRTVDVHRMYGTRTPEISLDMDGILVCGLDKLRSLLEKNYQLFTRIADQTPLVIIDEAHQSLAPTYRTLLNLLTNRHRSTRLLGLTATPGRTWSDRDEDKQLAEFFGQRKVKLEIEDYSNPVDYLVQEGYLAQTGFESLTYGGGSSISAQDIHRIQQSTELPQGILNELAEDDTRNLLIISRIEQLLRSNPRIIAFATTVAHAETIGAALIARNHAAATITGTTGATERRRRISQFKSDDGIPRVLINYGVLTTGFDAPRTSVALIARPTKSLVLYSQMVGRATRGPKAGGNSTATVVTVVDTTLSGFGDVAEAFNNWEDVWK